MKKINLILSRLAIVLAMAFMVACGGDPIKEDPTPTPDPEPDPTPDPTPELVVELSAELISAGSSSAQIKLTTKNLKEYAYLVGEKDADIAADIIFATGIAGACVDGENVVTVENLEPAKSYVVTFAGATIEDEFADVYAKVNVTTEAFVDELTIFNVGYNSLSAHFNYPTDKVQPGNVIKWGITEFPMYYENRLNLYSDAEMLNLNDGIWHNYITESTTFRFSEEDSYINESDALYSPIVPGQPMYLMFGEYAYSSEQTDHWGWGAGYYDAQFDMTNFIADYYATGKFPTDDTPYWTGYYRKEFVMSKEPDKMSAKAEATFNLTPLGGTVTITPPEGAYGVCFGVIDSSTFVGEILPRLNNKKDYLQWFITSYYAFGTRVAYAIMEESTIKLEDLYYMNQGKNYTLYMVTLGDELGSRQSFKSVDFKLPAATKPAPTAAVKGIDDPTGAAPQHDLVWFNLKCTSGNAVAAKYIANYEREWASMVSAFKKNYNITEEQAVEAMLDQYGAALTAEEIAQINTAEGWDINFSSRADANTICALAVMNDEGTWGYAMDEKRTIKEPYATPVNSPLFDDLQGEWTATTTIQSTHYHYCKDPNHKDNHDCAHPEPDSKDNNYLVTANYTVSSKVTIGNVGYEATLPEEVYQLFFNSSSLKTKEQVDAVYAQFTGAVDEFNANVRGQNRILCQGFDLEYDADKITCKYPECSDKANGVIPSIYANPYELFIADETKYSAYNYESPIYDFGPKWYLEIAADGTVTAPFNVSYFAPMAQWFQNIYQFMGASNSATLPYVYDADGNVVTGHFPVTVSADKNTITINPLRYTYTTKDENDIPVTRTEDFYPQIVRDNSNSSSVSYALYSRIVAPIVLTRNGAVAPAAATVAAPAAAKVEFEPVHEVKATRQAPRSRTAMPAVEMKAPAVVNYKVVNAEEFRAASKELSVAKLPRK